MGDMFLQSYNNFPITKRIVKVKRYISVILVLRHILQIGMILKL